MTSIHVENLTKRFGNTVAVDDLSLRIEAGELFFLLGPSGCGKTTLLRSIAGFVIPDSGLIRFGDEEVTRLAPHKRNTGMMFQSYALWPHMTVAQNVAFGLEERRLPRDEIGRRVGEALESVRMSAYASRKPNELSGGQQQRVALARALVVRPRCLLLDEPLSNLDAKLRLEMRLEIRRVCKEFQLTTVYVTHDQKEALSIADRLAILEGGRVLQVGSPGQVYRRPACRSVANFIGEADFLEGTLLAVQGDDVIVDTPGGRFVGRWGDASTVASPGTSVTLSVRPEAWRLAEGEGATNSLRGTVGASTYLGDVAQHDFVPEKAGPALKVLELNPQASGPRAGTSRYIAAAPDDVVVLTR